MKNMKLTYFNGRGRAEVARLILSIAGEVFEDDRVDFSDWEALKPRKLFYQKTIMPMIHINNITIKENIFYHRPTFWTASKDRNRWRNIISIFSNKPISGS